MPFLGKSPTAGFASIVKDDLTPNGSTTAFTLSKQVANANDIAVFLGNVRQEPTDAYTVSGTTLTMSAAPASGLNFYVLHIAGTLESSVVPADNTISTAKIQSNAITTAKIGASQITDAKIAGMTATKLTGTVSNARFPAGTVLQTLSGINSADQQLANDVSTFSTTLTLSITPTSTSSKIYILAHGSADVAGGHYRSIFWRVIRSVGGVDTQVKQMQYHMYDSNQQSHNIATQPIQALDSPNTTSAITYSLQGRHQTGSSQSGTYDGYLSRYSQSSITLMEIAQ